MLLSQGCQILLVKSIEANSVVINGMLFFFFPRVLLSFFPTPPPPHSPHQTEGRNVLALSEREKKCHGTGSENIKLIVDGVMLQTTTETLPELEVC